MFQFLARSSTDACRRTAFERRATRHASHPETGCSCWHAAIIPLPSGRTRVINRGAMTTTTKKTTSERPTSGVAKATRRQVLDIESLKPQGRDRLDFHEIHVSRLQRAMEEAWKAGARCHLGRARRAK